MRKVESKEATVCILRLGKGNNVVSWNEELKSVIGSLYGATANFLHTISVSYSLYLERRITCLQMRTALRPSQ